MAHEIETAVFSQAEGAGWTNLGQVIPANIARDPRKIAEICNALYNVEKRDLFYKTNEQLSDSIADYQALVRSDNGEVLHIASRNRYHVENRQPVEIFEAFRDQLAAESMEISHAAVLKGGRLIAVSALLKDGDVTPSDGERIKNYVTLSTGYDGAHGTAATLNSIRVVCANTWAANLAAAKKAGKAKTIRASQLIGKSGLAHIVGNVDQITCDQKRTYDAMRNRIMSESEVLRIFADVCKINIEDLDRTDEKGFDVVSTRAQNMLAALRASYSSAPGAEQGNAYGVFNAITHFATHVRSVRDTTGNGEMSARASSNLFGDNARMKSEALATLTQLAVAA